MRIWIDQGGAYGNLGDEAMLQCAAARLRRMTPRGECELVISAHPGKPLPELGTYERGESPARLLHDLAGSVRRRAGYRLGTRLHKGRWDLWLAGKLAARPWLLPVDAGRRVATLLEQMRRCDAYYAVGAANLHDRSLEHHVLPRLWAVRQFARWGKPVFVMGQTVGPLENPIAARAVREMVACSRLFTLRDPEVSPAWLARIGAAPGPVAISGDEAFDLVPASDAELCRYLAAAGLPPGQRFTLFHIRQKDYVQPIAADDPAVHRCLAALARRGPVLLCPMSYDQHSGDDHAFALAVREQASNIAALHVGGPIRAAAVARGLVARSEAVAALSYHLQVFAMAAGRPMLCLSRGAYYQHKAAAFAAWLPDRYRHVLELSDTTDMETGIARWWTDHTAMARELDRLRLWMQRRQAACYRIVGQALGHEVIEDDHAGQVVRRAA